MTEGGTTRTTLTSIGALESVHKQPVVVTLIAREPMADIDSTVFELVVQQVHAGALVCYAVSRKAARERGSLCSSNTRPVDGKPEGHYEHII